MHNMQLDHLVIFVPDLGTAMADFSALGFTVIAGGQHAATENALIVFEDETYIELLALKPGWKRSVFRAASGFIALMARSRQDMNWRLMNWVTRDYGSIDWCVRVPDVRLLLDDWADRQTASLGYQSFARQRPDGQLVEWHLGSLKDRDLPFMISDLTDRIYRIPGDVREHANGALGLAKVWLSVDDRQAAIRAFDHRFERSAENHADPASYQIGNVQIILTAPGHHNGKWALALTCAGTQRVDLDPAKSGGVSISLLPCHKTFG